MMRELGIHNKRQFTSERVIPQLLSGGQYREETFPQGAPLPLDAPECAARIRAVSSMQEAVSTSEWARERDYSGVTLQRSYLQGNLGALLIHLISRPGHRYEQRIFLFKDGELFKDFRPNCFFCDLEITPYGLYGETYTNPLASLWTHDGELIKEIPGEPRAASLDEQFPLIRSERYTCRLLRDRQGMVAFIFDLASGEHRSVPLFKYNLFHQITAVMANDGLLYLVTKAGFDPVAPSNFLVLNLAQGAKPANIPVANQKDLGCGRIIEMAAFRDKLILRRVEGRHDSLLVFDPYTGEHKKLQYDLTIKVNSVSIDENLLVVKGEKEERSAISIYNLDRDELIFSYWHESWEEPVDLHYEDGKLVIHKLASEEIVVREYQAG